MFNVAKFKEQFPLLDSSSLTIRKTNDAFFDAIQQTADLSNISLIYPSFYEIDDVITWKLKTAEYANHYMLVNEDQDRSFFLKLYAHLLLFNELNVASISQIASAVSSPKLSIKLQSGDSNRVSFIDNLMSVTFSKATIQELNETLQLAKHSPQNLQTSSRTSLSNFLEQMEVQADINVDTLRDLVKTKVKSIASHFQSMINFDVEPFVPVLLAHHMFLQDYDIFYTFSSIIKHDGNNKGLGGIFTIARKDNIFEHDVRSLREISDIMANRLTFQSITNRAISNERKNTFNLLWHSLNLKTGLLIKRARRFEDIWAPENDISVLSDSIRDFREYFSVVRSIEAPKEYLDKMKPDVMRFNVFELVQDAVGSITYDVKEGFNSFGCPLVVWRSLRERKTEIFALDIEKDIFVTGYRKVIEVIFINILTNAVKNYTDLGSAHANTEAQVIIRSTNEGSIIIENQKIIEDAHLRKWQDNLFSHFVGEYRASGLGIYTCKSFLRALGIPYLVNKTDTGTTVELFLKAAEDEQESTDR